MLSICADYCICKVATLKILQPSKEKAASFPEMPDLLWKRKRGLLSHFGAAETLPCASVQKAQSTSRDKDGDGDRDALQGRGCQHSMAMHLPG